METSVTIMNENNEYFTGKRKIYSLENFTHDICCLLYTSDAADDMQCVDLGGRRIIKKFVSSASGESSLRPDFFKQKTAYEM